MEYSTNVLAQAAYVTNASLVYGPNFLTGGTASADSVIDASYAASKAVDGDEFTQWYSNITALPHWWQYDLGSNITKTVRKLRFSTYADTSGLNIKDFTLQGSNDGSSWITVYTGATSNTTINHVWWEFVFNNSAVYRYYRTNVISKYRNNDSTGSFFEIQMMEATYPLQSYSEATIGTQGAYSLKGVATTGALNSTLTRTIASPINLTGQNQIKFDIYAGRTGSNIKIGIHDTGGTTTEITPNITSAGAWQTVTWDISGVSDANKDAIDNIIITIVNADAANTFYVDNMHSLIAPIISTSDASAITTSGATLNGDITDTGGENNTVRGFQYGVDTGYGSDTHTNGSYGTGTFAATISGLSPNVIYYFRAYSTNSAGTSYSSGSSFTTDMGAPVGTNISSDALEHWAWNDVIGWIDFYSSGGVNVAPNRIQGYATSQVGNIALDCATSPNGNICGTSNFKVANDGSGNLSGWAWNDAIGWISFYCGDLDPSCTNFNYRVTIDGAGDFHGWAWNDNVGWISFNCLDTGSCVSNYKVKTSWAISVVVGTVDSSVFDTGVAGGAAFNSILWQGNQPAGTNVSFQFASSNSTSTLTPIGPGGTSLSSDVYNTTGPGVPVSLSRAYNNNSRYFRYKIFLQSNIAHTLSPRVDNVIVNWSP